MAAGILVASRIVDQANEAVELARVRKDLMQRVIDWKSHDVAEFGSLLLHGVYSVTAKKGEQYKDVRVH